MPPRYYCSAILLPRDPPLFVERCLAAPITKLLEFDLALHRLLVFGGVIITPFANGTAEGDQFVRALYFRHKGNNTPESQKVQLSDP